MNAVRPTVRHQVPVAKVGVEFALVHRRFMPGFDQLFQVRNLKVWNPDRPCQLFVY